MAAATLVTGFVTCLHWQPGTSGGSAVWMTIDDYRLFTACPTQGETILDFVRRPPPTLDYAQMSDRYGDDWETRVCNGDVDFD